MTESQKVLNDAGFENAEDLMDALLEVCRQINIVGNRLMEVCQQINAGIAERKVERGVKLTSLE